MSRKEKILIILSSVLLFIALVLMFLCGKYSSDLKIAQHNINALNDTITIIRLDNGELLSSKNSLILEKEELQEYLDISKKEVKELERQLNDKLLYISKMNQTVKLDTIYITNEVTKQGDSYLYCFDDKNDYYHIAGCTEVKDTTDAVTTITCNEINADLKVGLTEDWRIFVSTNNPYITFSSIDGALVDKDYYLAKDRNAKKKKCDFGIQVQAGFGAQYGLVKARKGFNYGPYLGVGISYGFNF